MGHQQFFTLLHKVPRIAHLWDQKTGSMNVEAFEAELGVMSSGEVQIAKFFAALWFNNNKRYGFDLIEAIARFDTPEIKIIIEWISDPFWP